MVEISKLTNVINNIKIEKRRDEYEEDGSQVNRSL